MARSIDSIRSQIKTSYVAFMATVGIVITPSRWSRRNKQQMAINTFAEATGIFEQNMDAFTADIEALISVAAPHTGPWFQNWLLNIFQFNDTDPQTVIIAAPDFAPKYTTVNDDYKILKYVSVTRGSYGRCLIKVAAQDSGLPADVDTVYGAGTLDAVASAVTQIGAPEVTYVVTSGLADEIMIASTVYGLGQFAPVLPTTMKAAVIAFLAGIDFDAKFDLSDLMVAMKKVQGVKRVIFTNVNARANGTGFSAGSYNMVTGLSGSTPTGNWILETYEMAAGFAITETTTGYTIDDTITYKYE